MDPKFPDLRNTKNSGKNTLEEKKIATTGKEVGPNVFPELGKKISNTVKQNLPELEIFSKNTANNENINPNSGISGVPDSPATTNNDSTNSPTNSDGTNSRADSPATTNSDGTNSRTDSPTTTASADTDSSSENSTPKSGLKLPIIGSLTLKKTGWQVTDETNKGYFSLLCVLMEQMTNKSWEELEKPLKDLFDKHEILDRFETTMQDFFSSKEAIEEFLTIFDEENETQLAKNPKNIERIFKETFGMGAFMFDFIEEYFSEPTTDKTIINTDKTIINFDQKLGKGNFSTVYGTSNKNIVAKVNKTTNFTQLSILMHELYIMSKVNDKSHENRNISKVLGIKITNNKNEELNRGNLNGNEQLVIFLEKADMSLDKIEDSKFIDIDMFKDLSRQCINGLAGIHKAGITHRDIHPKNILQTSSEEAKSLYKIADFGVATSEEESKKVGTESVQPEDFDEETLSQKSDVYALGVSLMMLGLELDAPTKWGTTSNEKVNALLTAIEDPGLLTAVTEKNENEIDRILKSKKVSKEIKECINNHLAKGISIEELNEKATFILQLLQDKKSHPNAKLQNKESRPNAEDLMKNPYLKS